MNNFSSLPSEGQTNKPQAPFRINSPNRTLTHSFLRSNKAVSVLRTAQTIKDPCGTTQRLPRIILRLCVEHLRKSLDFESDPALPL